MAAAKRRQKPVVDKQARELIRQILEILEDLIDQNERQWNSLYSLWAEVETMQNREKLAKEARKLEKELNVK